MNLKILFLFGVLTLFLLNTMSAPVFAAEKKPVSVRISALGGFDNNSGLNSKRKGDFFAQESANVLYKRLLDRKSQLRLSYSGLNVNYFEATDQNILSNEVGAGISYLLTAATILEMDYSFQYLDFLRNDPATTYQNDIRTGFRQKIGSRWNLKGGFTFSRKDYENKKLRQADGIFSLDDERADGRYSLDSQLMYKFSKSVVLNAGTVIYWNDSNDQFHDNYDTESYKFYTGFSWQINPKWSSSARVSYEAREYDSRPIIGSTDTFQSDDTYSANLVLNHKLSSNMTVGSSYTYRQKKSNEPSQKYSGSLTTLGLYYSF